MKNIERSLRGALLAAPAALLLACGDSVTDPGQIQPFLGCPVTEIRLGQSRSGTLSPGDCRVEGYFTDMYQLEVFSERVVIIDLESSDFDAYLVLYNRRTGEILADNDDLNEVDSDARLSGFLPPGTYVVAATSFELDETGNYVLTVD